MNALQSKVESMIKYLENAANDMDVIFQVRGDKGHIAVIEKFKDRKQGKNVFTYWPTNSSVSVIILGKLDKKTYYSVEQMENDQISQKIKAKYSEMLDKDFR